MAEISRVLILSTAYLPEIGGSELAIKNITDRLSHFCFDLITSRPSKNFPKYEKIGNVNVYRVGGSLGLFPFLLPKNFFPISVFLKGRQLMRKNGPYDIVHAYQASQAAGGGWLLKWLYPKTPFFITVQEGKILDKQPWLMRFFRGFLFKKADTATTISNYLAQYVRSQSAKIPITVIPNGVDLNKFKVEGRGDKNTIITVSRLVEKNGVADLIDAMALVKNKIPDAKLIIVGDGPLKESLKLKAKSLKLENQIEFAGEVLYADTPKYLAGAAIFVRPSLSEGLGSAFLEAMASGLAVVGTPVGGIPDFLKDGETGLFCRPGDPEDIAEKIIKVIEDDSLRQKLAENGRRLVEEKYSWDKIAEQFKELYVSI